MHRPSLEALAAKAEAHFHRIRGSGDQQQALDAAAECARIYAALGNPGKESDFLYDVGKCQVLTGDYAAAFQTSEVLLASPRTHEDPVFMAQALLVRAAALRNQSQHVLALETARQALAVLAHVRDGDRALAEAYQGIIACLVEADQAHDAWAIHDKLSATLAPIDDPLQAGQGYWTLGNLAFATGHEAEGAAYHQLAAKQLQQINDIHLWARFNNASADVQLQAGVANQRTHDNIVRAQLAYGIIGGSAVEFFGLSLTQARWHVANGELEEASSVLEKALADAQVGGAPVDASVHRMWSQILLALGRTDEADRENARAARIERPRQS